MIGVKALAAPEWNISEILRYARTKADADTTALIDECIREAEAVLEYHVSFTRVSITQYWEELSFGLIHTASHTIKKAVIGCDSLLIFAATIGTPFDRLIQKYSRISPSKALILHAIGAERVEALCDQFSRDYSISNGIKLRPRVSPGYGDISLSMQRDIFAMLDCPRKIGLTLNDDLLMSPSKSVTAIAGITDLSDDTVSVPDDCSHKCTCCDQTSCIYREG